MTAITVVGVGADGVLAAPVAGLLAEADVVLGGERHLALVPSRPGQQHVAWPRPMSELPHLLARLDADAPGRRVVALASGDPLVSGVGTTLVGLLGADAVQVLPAVSSVALARARMGWSAERCDVVTLVGRDVAALRRHLASGHRLLVLTSDEHAPGEIGRLLTDAGYGASRVSVLGDLGGDAETRLDTRADDLGAGRPSPSALPRLHVLAVELDGVDGPAASWATGLADACFESDGQLSRRDVRAGALARLAPRPGHLLWDVGAGAGSVGIEWLRAHPTTRAVAVEADPARAERITRNAAALGVPRLQVVSASAPDALADLPRPDAIFVGGGATATGLLDACRDALRPGGRLVVHGVTLETEALLLAARAAHGGELTRVSVEQVTPLGGRFTGWTPARAVVSWAWVRPAVPCNEEAAR